MIRDARYKLIYYATGIHSHLFDMIDDPQKMVDLAPAGALAGMSDRDER